MDTLSTETPTDITPAPVLATPPIVQAPVVQQTDTADIAAKQKIESSITELIVLLREYRRGNGFTHKMPKRTRDESAEYVLPLVAEIKTFMQNTYSNVKPGEKINFAQIKTDIKGKGKVVTFDHIGMAVADSDNWALDNGGNVFFAIRLDETNKQIEKSKHGRIEVKYRNMIHVLKGEPKEAQPVRQPKQKPQEQETYYDDMPIYSENGPEQPPPVVSQTPPVSQPPSVSQEVDALLSRAPPSIEPTFDASETI